MNHDATHCADFTKDCPKDCYRAMLSRDLENKETLALLIGVPLSWASLKGTKECKRREL